MVKYEQKIYFDFMPKELAPGFILNVQEVGAVPLFSLFIEDVHYGLVLKELSLVVGEDHYEGEG